MDNLKLLITEKDEWWVSEGEYNELPFILRYRPNLGDFILTNTYNKRIVVIWTYESDNTSLIPDDKTLELMEKVEDSAVTILEEDIQAVLAFVYTSANKKEWHWYSSNISETEERLNQAFTDFDVLPIELFVEDDPEWKEYKSVLEGASTE